MNYLEIKTESGDWVYKTSELGDLKILSEEKMTVEDVQQIHMFYMKQNKVADGDEIEGKKVWYKPYDKWEDLDEKKQQEVSKPSKVEKFINYLINLL